MPEEIQTPNASSARSRSPSRVTGEPSRHESCPTTPIPRSWTHRTTAGPGFRIWSAGYRERSTSRSPRRIRVWLNFEHEPGFRAVVGHGVALREAPDALYGTFRVEPGPDGDKALHMVNEGVLTGLSIEAIPKKSRRTVEGIVERVKAHLDKVSLVREGLRRTRMPQVLAVREARRRARAEDRSLRPNPRAASPTPNARTSGRDASADGLRAADQAGSRDADLERRTGQVHRRGVRALHAHLPSRRFTAEGALLAAGSGAQRRREHQRSRSGGCADQSGHERHCGAEVSRCSQAASLLPAGGHGTAGVSTDSRKASNARSRAEGAPRARTPPLGGTPGKARHPPGIHNSTLEGQTWHRHSGSLVCGWSVSATSATARTRRSRICSRSRKRSSATSPTTRQEQVTKYRTRVVELEDEILALATDIERANDSKDISKLVRADEEGDERNGEPALGNPQGRGRRRSRLSQLRGVRHRRVRDSLPDDRGAGCCQRQRQGVRRAGAGATRKSTGQHALLERSRSGAATAHRADHGSHQRLSAGRQLRAATRARQRDADVSEDRTAPRGSGAGFGEDRGRNEEPAGHAGDAHRRDVSRWRRHLLAGHELVKPGHAAVVVRPRCRGVRTGNRVGGLRGSRIRCHRHGRHGLVVWAPLARRTSAHGVRLPSLPSRPATRPPAEGRRRTRSTSLRTGSSSWPDSAPIRRCRSRLSAHSTSAP